MRASSVVKRQSTLAPNRLRSLHHACVSRPSVSASGNRRLRHCRTKTESSISTMFNQEPCTGV
jgi:hypothetical protein